MNTIIKWRTWKYNYQQVKGYFWAIPIVLFIIITIFCVTCNSSKQTFDEYFNEAITEYQANTGVTLYPYGIECLKKASTNCKNKEEVLEIIYQNEKWFRK